MSLSDVAVIKFSPAATPAQDFGFVPKLEWIAIADLGVDKSYQRDILENGRASVKRIVENFRWSRFAPLVVSRREGGRYAIIDGQHRAAAALILGIPKVPCLVIAVDVEEEARSFASINGDVTKPNGLQIFHARLAAGDGHARALRTVCERAAVSVPRNIILVTKPGQTLAIGALQSCLVRHGAPVLELALRCVVETGGGNAGLLRAAIIHGLCDAIAERPDWRKRERALIAAIEKTQIKKIYATVLRKQAVDGGAARKLFSEQVTKMIDIEFAHTA